MTTLISMCSLPVSYYNHDTILLILLITKFKRMIRSINKEGASPNFMNKTR
jgi:hypothetical protein